MVSSRKTAAFTFVKQQQGMKLVNIKKISNMDREQLFAMLKEVKCEVWGEGMVCYSCGEKHQVQPA